MASRLSTRKLTGKHVFGGPKEKRIGKVRSFVFHPSSRRVIGLIVKRPDAALMFHRKDAFLSLGSFDVREDGIHALVPPAVAERNATLDLDLDWDECVLWVGMPLITAAGLLIGYVEDVAFDASSGEVLEVTTEGGLANDVILGRHVVPVSMIEGFRRGPSGTSNEEDAMSGAILVSDEAVQLDYQGGVAAAAGKATAVVADKARKGTAKAKAAIDEKMEEAKPAMDKAAAKADEVVQSGAYAAGKQLGRASGMFSSFKDEFNRALHEGDDDAS